MSDDVIGRMFAAEREFARALLREHDGEAETEIVELQAVLAGLEWLPGTLSHNRLCPVCHAVECDGHHTGCRLASALGRTTR